MKKKKLIIYDNQGNPASEYPVPPLVDESRENWWASRLFAGFRKKASDKKKVDSWDLKSEEE
jgi:hypothetical protein